MSEFDEKAKQWDQNQMHIERTRAVASEMLRQIPLNPSMKALEFGAGTGLLSFFLNELFAEITLMDSSREMLDKAETKLDSGDHGRIKTLFLDLEKSEVTIDRYDVIFTQMVLHHIKDVSGILGKFYQMLLPGGFIAIADLYSEDGSFHDPGAEVHHGFDPEELSNQMKAAGFGNIVCNQCFVIRRETGSENTREFPVFLLTARK